MKNEKKISNDEKKRCSARSKRTGEQCKNFVMKDKKVCRFHGGKSNGAPKGNKNSIKHGAYESISICTMNEKEIEFTNNASMDIVHNLKEQLKILKVREMRILIRIKYAIQSETQVGTKNNEGKSAPSFVVVGGSQGQTQHPDGSVTKVAATTNESHAAFILRLENALTTVQESIRRVLDSLSRATSDTGGGELPLPLYRSDPYAE